MRVTERHVDWATPSPLWSATAKAKFLSPAILRFTSDSFMDEFLAQMAQDPSKLPDLQVAPETWSAMASANAVVQPKTGLALKLEQARNAAVRRLEARGAGSPTAAVVPVKPLKLYQAVHQRFYLVAAHLVCRLPGLPDHRVNPATEERATFVLRMLYPRVGAPNVNPDPAQCDELAFDGKAWFPIADPTALFAGEEQHALAPITYKELDGRNRRLWTGLVPTGKREALAGASRPAKAGQPSFDQPVEPRQMQFKTKVLGPWANLESIGLAANTTLTTASFDPNQPDDPGATATRQRVENQIITVSWYVLLDFAKFLEQWIPAAWDAIKGTGPQTALSQKLAATAISGLSFARALLNAHAHEQQLESVTGPYSAGAAGWPAKSLIFPLAVISGTGVAPIASLLNRKSLEALIVAALPQLPQTQTLPAKAMTQAASTPPTAAAWYTIRCVYERPNCGVLSPPLLSDPTASFQIAAFFDPDAPARPVRIGLPADPTPAGLRKFDKNAAFVMSDLLCKQVGRMGSISFGDLIMSVLPFPLHKDLSAPDGSGCVDEDGISVGMVCSLSIPIITICAFILLIIFIKLLDIVFFWMPFFQICLPIPKFQSKGDS